MSHSVNMELQGDNDEEEMGDQTGSSTIQNDCSQESLQHLPIKSQELVSLYNRHMNSLERIFLASAMYEMYTSEKPCHTVYENRSESQ